MIGCLIGFCFAAKVKSDYDKTANFSTYKTYAWGTNQTPTRQAADIVITGAVNHQLQSRGLQQSNDINHVDLIVRYTAAGDRDMNFGSADPTFAQVGGAPLPGSTVWTSGFGGPTGGRFVKKGSLVIDIFDLQQHRLIWSSMAEGSVKDKTQEAIEQINKAVAEMFESYPAKPQE